MSLIICPDCGHEVSAIATKCPNCGHPFTAPVIERKVVVANTPTREEGLPNWAFVLFGLIGVVLLFAVFLFVTRNNQDDSGSSNINVNLATKKTPEIVREKTPSQTVNLPPATGSQPVSVPSGSAPSGSAPSSVTTVPASPNSPAIVPKEMSDKGMVMIDAKVETSKGAVQNVKSEKFYLLDDSLDSILSRANLEPIEGQTLVNSFGLSVLYPSRYSDFNRDALNAIKSHIKYNVLTDSNGKAQIKEVKPDSYYLFGVTKSGNAFAVWDSPVTIQTGQNILNLSPQPLTEVANNSAEDE
jgi:hypothetical protein